MTADRIRVWLGVALLGLVMLGSFWIYEVMRRQSEDEAANAKNRSEPDYYVENFNFVRLSQSKQTNYRVTGEKLIHYPREDEFEIVQPRIVGIDQEKTPMTIRAERAIVKQKVQEKSQSKPEDQIHMQGNVLVERSKSDQGGHLTMATNSLILFPDSERMRTSEQITMTTARANITANGMEADNSTQKIRLLNKVQISIAPPSSK
ncbi:LPS export ABC transporter periplasmic protein LptC [Undibacterium baiyunense]|jgi:lipopolysaccharide export system protein LptC|uniref:LPS export ABC transporter periplasmic protein LptC n=1 Tax=Undibacterium baiyunense TaxID=2828731 RepID=A0A941DLE1_9BURK|nr:LPS export ABC transporter periplasmic protein LptC [Undibacterium baiyunense]MBR7748272.1 LPS export ABC transporter periplasmic protein LptC [Undibacterium baiyunense]